MKLKLSIALSAVLVLGVGTPGSVATTASTGEGALTAPVCGFGPSRPAAAAGQQYPGRSDEDALALAARQDPALFATQPTRTLDPPAGATVERYLDDCTRGLMFPGQGPDVIAYFTTPLRSQQDGVKRPIDLKLVDRGSAIEPGLRLSGCRSPTCSGKASRLLGTSAAEARVAGQWVFYATRCATPTFARPPALRRSCSCAPPRARPRSPTTSICPTSLAWCIRPARVAQL